MFCPKCGSILKPKLVDGKKILSCSCGHKSKDTSTAVLSVKSKEEEQKVEVVESEENIYPTTDAECPKCGHKKAFYWLVQTRAADEPETKFLKCEKCKHTWRDYN